MNIYLKYKFLILLNIYISFSQIPVKPLKAEKSPYLYLLPSLGIQQGKPVISFQLGQFFEAYNKFQNDKYLFELNNYNFFMESLKVSKEKKLNYLDYLQAINDSIYFNDKYFLAEINFKRGDIKIYEIMDLKKSIYDQNIKLQKMKIELFE